MASKNDQPRDAADGFEGGIAGLGLSDVIQLNVHNRFSGCIRIQHGESSGLIFFRDGSIIHAEQDGKTGEEAFYDMVGWRAGHFSVQPNVSTTQSTIQKGWQHLLLEAHRVLDERRAGVAGVRAEVPRVPQAAPPARPAAGSVMERLQGVPGVAYAVAQTRDGARVDDDTFEGEVLAGQATFLASLGKRLGSIFRAGELSCATVQGSTRHVLFYVTKKHYLSVFAHGESNAGAVDGDVRRALSGSGKP